MDVGKLTEYANFKKDIKKREKQLKIDKKKVEAQDKEILEMFTKAGMTEIRLGGTLIYLKTQTWAGAMDLEDTFDEKGNPVKDYARACTALRESGLGEFVKEGFNTMTVSAEIRRLLKTVDGVPDNLENNMKISDKYSVCVR